MPYVLSPLITENCEAMWMEGKAYEKKSLYSMVEGKLPPVNYDEHLLRPHSLTHMETPAHTLKDGKTLETYFSGDQGHFFGKTLVLKLNGDHYREVGNGIKHWIIERTQIEERLSDLEILSLPPKVLISTEFYEKNKDGFHDPSFVLTLSQSAADFLISQPDFHLYGTSWKSSDYNPGRTDRPIHNTLFKKALILENLILHDVPEGIYFMTSFPLPLTGSSESPVVPVLFTKEEILKHL